MDIMRPPLEQQVSPAPWLVAHSKIDIGRLIQQALAHQPDASIDAIVRQLSDWSVQVSGIIISMWMLKLRRPNARIVSIPPQASDSYCNCDPLPCTCCKPTPDWWHQYCCDVQLSDEQVKARDKYLEPRPRVHEPDRNSGRSAQTSEP